MIACQAAQRALDSPPRRSGSSCWQCPAQEAIVTALRRRTRVAAGDADGFVPEADILGQAGSNRASLTALIRKGIVEEVERIQGLHIPVVNGRQDRVPELTPAQSVAWSAIERALHARDSTRFYSMASPAVGKLSSICALRPGAFARQISTCARAGDRPVIPGRRPVRLPLRRSGGDPPLRPFRRGALRRLAGIAAGRHPVVVGPRSALFASAPDVGLIVLDEEHDPAYKQNSVPRYHARSVAEHWRGRWVRC